MTTIGILLVLLVIMFGMAGISMYFEEVDRKEKNT